ncbi:sensory box histidine kinase [Vibrio ishigakensis]|uniref:Sensory box histidine kinase n=1 Tax=Vibrio ishigakensis TaxID=1481914 RepID=A0A0B8PEI0_9VIBR|nr:sensory box histidine kinase [Vibrio ishigakensis]
MAGLLRLLLISALSLFSLICWAEQVSPITKQDLFTQQELAWIEKHPNIRVSNSTDLPPLAFKQDGQVVGYSIDYIDLLSEITGLTFVFEYQEDWSEQLQQAEERQLDMLQLVRERESIDRYMDFTHLIYPAVLLFFMVGMASPELALLVALKISLSPCEETSWNSDI